MIRIVVLVIVAVRLIAKASYQSDNPVTPHMEKKLTGLCFASRFNRSWRSPSDLCGSSQRKNSLNLNPVSRIGIRGLKCCA